MTLRCYDDPDGTGDRRDIENDQREDPQAQRILRLESRPQNVQALTDAVHDYGIY